MRRISRSIERWLIHALNGKVVLVLFLLPAVLNVVFVPVGLRRIVAGSLFNAEACQFLWTQHGNSFWFSYFVSAGIGTYELLFWTVLIAWLRRWLASKHDLQDRYQQFRMYIRRYEWSLPWRVFCGCEWLGLKVYHFFVPKDLGMIPYCGDWRAYLPALPTYGILQGGEWTGIGYMLKYRLYLVAALPLLALGNVLKIFLIGGIGVVLSRQSDFLRHNPAVLILGIFLFAFSKKLFEKRLERLRTKWLARPRVVAEASDAPPP